MKIFNNMLLAILLLAFMHLANAYNHNITPVPADFYTPVTAAGESKSGGAEGVTVSPGATARYSFIIPPGVDQFYVSSMTVNSWNCFGSGECYYDHSFENYASADDYGIAASTGYTSYFVFTAEDSVVLRSTATTSETKGYFVVKNSSPYNWQLMTMQLQMRISDPDVYNAWVASSAPSSSTSSSGGSTSTSSSSTSSTSSSSSSTSSSSSSGGTISSTNSKVCGGFTGIPCAAAPAPVVEEPEEVDERSDLLIEFEAALIAALSEYDVDIRFSEDDDFIYFEVDGGFDFGDGNGMISTVLRFKVSKDKLSTFFKSNENLIIEQQHEYHEVEGFSGFYKSSTPQRNARDDLFFYPRIESEGAIAEKIMAFDNIIFASISDHGVLYVVDTENKVHRGVLNHNMVPLAGESAAAKGTIRFDRVNDINEDGYDDYVIIYDSSINYKQYLYYLPPPVDTEVEPEVPADIEAAAETVADAE